MNIDIKETEDSVIYSTTQKMFTKILDKQEKESLKVIEQYCEENNIIPNLIDKCQLDLVLRLGIAELIRLEILDKGSNKE